MTDKKLTNLSAVLHGKMDLRVEYREIPEPKDDEVLIHINSVGICGSDVHFWMTGGLAKLSIPHPTVMGHEPSGIVTKCGKDVNHLKPGDRVAVEPGIPCKSCDVCRIGRYNICQNTKYCSAAGIHGTLCEYYAHKAEYCHKLPDNVSMEEGAAVQPLAIAVHACRRAGISFGNKLLICGAGPIGVMMMLTSKAMGASKVVMTDINENRLNIAKKLGADHTLLVSSDAQTDDLVEQVVKILGVNPDISIDCAGCESTSRLGILATKVGGTFLLVGLQDSEMRVPLTIAAFREVDIRGTNRLANSYPTAIEMVSTGKVNLKPLITHRFDLTDSEKAFQAAKNGEGIKIIIKCGAPDA